MRLQFLGEILGDGGEAARARDYTEEVTRVGLRAILASISSSHSTSRIRKERKKNSEVSQEKLWRNYAKSCEFSELIS